MSESPAPKRYRFGGVSYTLAEIEECDYRHGVDGICYYPPPKWGPRGVQDHAPHTAYDNGFDRGRASRKAEGLGEPYGR